MKSYSLRKFEGYWIAEDKKYGKALILSGPWTRRYFQIIKRNHVKIIRLNDYSGWVGDDISFVPTIHGIWGVDIMSKTVTDVSPVFEIEGLRTLSLFCKARVAGDFLKLKKLESVDLQWSPAYLSLFGLKSLRRINILGFPYPDLTGWELNRRTLQLRLESRSLHSLTGIERFPSLKSLELYRCRNLNRLDALPNAQSIQTLELSYCPALKELSAIGQLRELRVLEIQNCHTIDSVAPLAQCKKLQRLQIAGNTVIADGDFSPLRKLTGLKEVLLANKKHYSHTAEELERN